MPTKKKTPQTRLTGASVSAFLTKSAAGPRLADAKAIARMMQAATGAKAKMWGPAIVGFDTCQIPYADGRLETWPLIAFSPRKSAFVLYIGWRKHPDLVKKIGKHKTAGGCLHIKTLADVDRVALQRLIDASTKSLRAKYRQAR